MNRPRLSCNHHHLLVISKRHPSLQAKIKHLGSGLQDSDGMIEAKKRAAPFLLCHQTQEAPSQKKLKPHHVDHLASASSCMLSTTSIDSSSSTMIHSSSSKTSQGTSSTPTTSSSSTFQLTATNATSVIHNYMSSLRNDLTLHNAVYDVETIGGPYEAIAEANKTPQFRCFLRFPINAGIRLAVSSGISHPSKAKARNSAAFEACQALRELGEFDDNYTPTPARANPKKKGSSARSTLSATSGSQSPVSSKVVKHGLESSTASSSSNEALPPLKRHIIASGKTKPLPGSPESRQVNGTQLAYMKLKQDNWGKLPPRTAMGSGGILGVQEYPWLSSPRFWAKCPKLGTGHLYGTLLRLKIQSPYQARGDLCRTLCLVTSQPLPSLTDGGEQMIEVQRDITQMECVSAGFIMKPIGKLEGWDDTRLEAAFKFTKKLLRATMNRAFVCQLDDSKYLLVPMITNYTYPGPQLRKSDHQPNTGGTLSDRSTSTACEVSNIDNFAWEDIAKATGPIFEPFNLDTLADPESNRDSVASMPAEMARRYYILSTRHDLTPRSIIPPATKTLAELVPSADSKEFLQLPSVTRWNQPIFQAEQACNAKSGGYIYATTSPKFHNHFLIPEIYQKHFLSASVLRTASMIPTFMNTLNDHLVASEMNENIFHNALRPDLALQAIQCPTSRAQGDRCYERLEMLGDTLLKLLVTFSVYLKFRGDGEHRMTHERGLVVSNSVLRNNTVDSGVVEYIRFTVVKDKEWRPPSWHYSETGSEESASKKYALDGTTQLLGDKTVADISEALIAAAYLSNPDDSLTAAMRAMTSLKMEIDHLSCWEDIVERHSKIDEKNVKSRQVSESSRAMTVMGYTFKDSGKAKTALSLAQTAHQQVVFQEYEFLGDALIDHLTLEDLWHRYRDSGPASLTLLKHSRVSNAAFSAYAVKSGLIEQLLSVDAITQSDLAKFKKSISEAQREADIALTASPNVVINPNQDDDLNEGVEYWFNVRQNKQLGDVVEAVFGAIFDDCGFSMDIIKNVFSNTLKPFTDKYCAPPRRQVTNPKALYLEMMSTRPCFQFEIERLPVDARGKFGSVVYMHNQEIAKCFEDSAVIATRKACDLALKKIKKGEVDLEKLCDCRRVGRIS